MMIWTSALPTYMRFIRAQAAAEPVRHREHLSPAAAILGALYAVLPGCDLPGSFFTFLCTTIPGFVEERLVVHIEGSIACLYKCLGVSLARFSTHESHLLGGSTSAQTVTDTVKTAAALLSATERVIKVATGNAESLRKRVAGIVQDLLARYVSPEGPNLAAADSSEGPPSAGTCVSVIATMLLRTLVQCAEHSPVLNIDIRVLIRCSFCPLTEHFVHMVIVFSAGHAFRPHRVTTESPTELLSGTLSPSLVLLRATVSRFKEWIGASGREIVLAEHAIKDWLLKNTDANQGANFYCGCNYGTLIYF
jgi:hypothetical protein